MLKHLLRHFCTRPRACSLIVETDSDMCEPVEEQGRSLCGDSELSKVVVPWESPFLGTKEGQINSTLLCQGSTLEYEECMAKAKCQLVYCGWCNLIVILLEANEALDSQKEKNLANFV